MTSPDVPAQDCSATTLTRTRWYFTKRVATSISVYTMILLLPPLVQQASIYSAGFTSYVGADDLLLALKPGAHYSVFLSVSVHAY